MLKKILFGLLYTLSIFSFVYCDEANIWLTKGDTETIVFTFTDSNGDDYNIASNTFTFAIGTTPKGTDVLTKTDADFTLSGNDAILELSTTDTNQDLGGYYWNAFYVDTNAKKFTFGSGNCVFVNNATGEISGATTIIGTQNITISLAVAYGTQGSSTGDMLKSTYDTDEGGIVDNSERVDSVTHNYTSLSDNEIIQYDSATSSFINQTFAEASILSSFDVSADSGSNQTITDGQTLNIAGGTNISTVAGASDVVTINGSQTPTFTTAQFTPGAAPGHSEGLVYYDSTTKTLCYYTDTTDVIMNIGEEVWFRVKNNTGSTITNGQVCYLSGVDSGIPTIELANASSVSSLATLGFATEDILNGATGRITTIGTVRNVDTSSCTPGNVLYLSTTSGNYTETAPESPNYLTMLGVCGDSNAVTGTIFAHVTVGDNMQSILKINNGLILESHTTTVTSNGTTITLSLEKTGGGDLSLIFDSQFSNFDSTPVATVNLTAGTDTVPVLNYVYIPASTMVITANTTGFPSAQHVAVATVLCQSASSIQTNGVYKWHAWTDHFVDSNDQGHISHLNKWIRNQNATWLSGSQFSTSVGVGTSDVSTTAGQMLQLHQHAVDAFNTATGSDVYVVNDNTTPYKKVGDLTGELTDSEGATLSSKHFSFVFWVASSEGSGNDKLFVNLPAGSYNSSSAAIADDDNYSNYTIPTEFRGTGVLLARITYQHSTAGGGTWTVSDSQDLRGSSPSGFIGGGGGSATIASSFSDALFNVYDNADDTKKIKLEASGITGGQTRTLTVQDKSYTLADASIVALNTTHRTSNGSDHTYIDQDITSGSAPTLTATNFTGSSGITGLGTIATGTWQGTAIADAYVANDLTISGGTVDNSVIGGSTPAAATFTNAIATTMNIGNVSNPLNELVVSDGNGISYGYGGTGPALEICATNNYDAALMWTKGSIYYTAGIDNTDGNWSLNQSTTLGTTEVLRVETDKNINVTQQLYTGTESQTPTTKNITVNFNNGESFSIDLESAGADIDITLSNVVTGNSYLLDLVQGATARQISTITPGITWYGGATPNITTTANATTIIGIWKSPSGTIFGNAGDYH